MLTAAYMIYPVEKCLKQTTIWFSDTDALQYVLFEPAWSAEFFYSLVSRLLTSIAKSDLDSRVCTLYFTFLLYSYSINQSINQFIKSKNTKRPVTSQ